MLKWDNVKMLYNINVRMLYNINVRMLYNINVRMLYNIKGEHILGEIFIAFISM